jgi:hypothetical protein
MFIEFNPDILQHICTFLDIQSVLSLALCCREWNEVATCESQWRRYCVHHNYATEKTNPEGLTWCTYFISEHVNWYKFDTTRGRDHNTFPSEQKARSNTGSKSLAVAKKPIPLHGKFKIDFSMTEVHTQGFSCVGVISEDLLNEVTLPEGHFNLTKGLGHLGGYAQGDNRNAFRELSYSDNGYMCRDGGSNGSFEQSYSCGYIVSMIINMNECTPEKGISGEEFTVSKHDEAVGSLEFHRNGARVGPKHYGIRSPDMKFFISVNCSDGGFDVVSANKIKN